MAKREALRIAILGAGPIGIEAALTALSLDCQVQIFEQGAPGDSVQRWGFVRMFTPFGLNTTPRGKDLLFRENPKRDWPAETDLLTGREFRDAYLVPLVETPTLKPILKTQTSVISIGRSGWRKTEPETARKVLPPFRILVRDAQGVERFETADVVLDCTGTYSRPNWIGDGAIPAAGETAARSQIALHLDEILGSRKPQYAGKSIILVGSGYSAATAMLDLATLAEENQSTWVIWLTHGPRTQPLPRLANDPFKERDRLAARANHLALRCDGNLEYHPQTQLDEILSHGVDKGFRVSGRIAGKPMTWDVERVIAHVGYRPNLDFCQELRVQEPTGSFRTAEPDYYFLGAKSWGRDSGFFLREGYRQIEELLPRLVSGGATAR